MLTVKQIGVLSLAKFMGILYAGLGLIFGVFASLFSIFGVILGRQLATEFGFRNVFGATQGSAFSILFGIGAIITLPIFYGILGFIGGLIMGFIANIALRISGGLELKVKTK